MSGADLSPFNDILARLERVADRLEQSQGSGQGASPPGAAPAAAELPAVVSEFDAFVKDKLPAIESAAAELGVKEVTDGTETFKSCVKFLRELLLASGKCKKPNDADWGKVLGPVMTLGQAAQKACDNRSEFFHHQKSVAEALNIVTLVTMASPAGHVKNVLEAMDFHAIKVMQKKKPPETQWIKALKDFVKDLTDWCAANFKMGLVWKAQGVDMVEYFAAAPLGSGGSAAPAAGGKAGGKGKGPPMPKGGVPKPPPLATESKEPSAGGGGMSAVFAAINGIDGTGGLKKVTDDMKTKNRPKDDTASAAPKPSPPKPAPAKAQPKFNNKGPKGQPKKSLEKDLNWMIENYDGVPDLSVEEATMQQLVCVLNCRNTTIKLGPRVKSVSVDSCEKVNIICYDVMSAVEVVNCERCNVQTLGKVNSFAIDKSNGVNVHLSKESLGADFLTSTSSEMNITIPKEGSEDGDIVEIPIPEQFVTKIKGTKVVTGVSGIYSG
mmetsp:Transcript_35956/g.101243  ORF Transcript_35956/g.101243 Transcript_35956/m.101243 type:complete len:495 (-) Transcript_35956:80-1564(-)